jgi:chloramphenicol-sensitive protein RarD
MKMSTRAEFVPLTPADAAERREAALGVAFGLGAYFTWGFLPIYLKALATVSAPEVLAHRILWSLLLVAGIAVVARRGAAVAALLRAPRPIGVLALTATLIGVNWLTYIWAVNSGQVLETSLGYFINPLVNVALGVFVLRERLRRPQIAAVTLAAVGVAVLAVAQGGLPWIALVLAFSFGVYGLLRKMAPVDPLTGLLGETAILAPLCLAYLLWLGSIGAGSFGASAWIDFLLVLSGLVTAAPLLMFAAAGKRLRYATIGLLQYIAPTIQFLLAVLLFGEALTAAHLVTFAFIWAGLALYAADAVRATRRG